MRIRCPFCEHHSPVGTGLFFNRKRCFCRHSDRNRPLSHLQRRSMNRMGKIPIVVGMVLLGIFGLVAGFVWRMMGGTTPVAFAAEPKTAVVKAASAPRASYEKELLPFIKRYCSDCHGDGAQEGDFSLDRYTDLASIQHDRAVWTKLLKLLQLESMPPSTADQPTPEERARAVAWLDHQLFYVDCEAEQNPGRVTVRRLNRTEYNNTVNALLDIRFKPADNFPSDDVGHGFDNIADVLTVPPLLIEKYLAAAESIADVVSRNLSPLYFQRTIAVADWKNTGSVNDRKNGKAFLSRGTISTSVDFPRPGPYRLRVAAWQDKAGNEAAQLQVKLAGKEIKTVDVVPTRPGKFLEIDIPVSSNGRQEVSLSFLNDFYDDKVKKNGDRNLHLREVEVSGPLDQTKEEASRRRLIRYFPDKKTTFVQAATRNLEEFLPLAFRRPVTTAEVARFVEFAQAASQQDLSFSQSMGIALQAILISPDFLFRMESGRRRDGQIEMLDDYALASRLSYFLWSSCPDDELFDLAKANRLHDPEIFKSQTLRMLSDPRAEELVKNFSSQWLGLRKLSTAEVSPDTDLFPDFTNEIRNDLWKETELYFESILREDRSVFELLTGKYTFLNERLAKYYGIEGVKGPEFRKVSFNKGPRTGILTQGSILTLTSYPNRTSPVKRGEWVLSVLLGDAPPPPPPSVPALEQTSQKNPNLSFRETLELHRTDPGCASCHKTMDAVGFALENFDAVGRWRDQDHGRPVDSAGMLPDGTKINGPDDLTRVLVGRRDEFARHLSEKMLTFAIGRGVEWTDRCAIDGVMEALEQDDRFSTFILAIVNSAPFQARTIVPPDSTN